MKALASHEQTVVSLPAYTTLSIAVSETGAGTIERLANNPGDPSLGTTTVSGNMAIGPFAVPTRHLLRCSMTPFSYDSAPADFAAVTSAIERITTLSQPEYDALSPPEPATLYLIMG
ncbi:hypothetical protein NKI12_09930 [Mesorhizobium australicum]|uniref:Uncharacterized protein n=1 Tax=Mesorhizobium australicum TaxID=536018 RepID=A0ACC6SWT8_9HYPH